MSQQENFVSHLVELRDRLLRAVVGFLIVFVALMAYPGAAYIFDLLALPIQSALPEGTKMIATGVITPFMVPVKLTAMVAFVISLPILLYQAWAFIAPGLYQHEKKWLCPLFFQHSAVSRGYRFLSFHCIWQGVCLHQRFRTTKHYAGT